MKKKLSRENEPAQDTCQIVDHAGARRPILSQHTNRLYSPAHILPKAHRWNREPNGMPECHGRGVNVNTAAQPCGHCRCSSNLMRLGLLLPGLHKSGSRAASRVALSDRCICLVQAAPMQKLCGTEEMSGFRKPSQGNSRERCKPPARFNFWLESRLNLT